MAEEEKHSPERPSIDIGRITPDLSDRSVDADMVKSIREGFNKGGFPTDGKVNDIRDGGHPGYQSDDDDD